MLRLCLERLPSPSKRKKAGRTRWKSMKTKRVGKMKWRMIRECPLGVDQGGYMLMISPRSAWPRCSQCCRNFRVCHPVTIRPYVQRYPSVTIERKATKSTARSAAFQNEKAALFTAARKKVESAVRVGNVSMCVQDMATSLYHSCDATLQRESSHCRR